MSTHQDNMPRPPSFVDPATVKGYELTGKIMMSAIIIVFAVVVVMVLLHIYARWYIIRNHRRGRRRRTHLVFYVEPNSASDVVSFPSSGLDPALLKSLPTFVFSSSAGYEEEQGLECAVCLSEFEDGEKGRLLPKCNHRFHVDCIDMWFHSHSTCPLCRATVDGKFPSPMKEIDENLPVEIVVELSASNRGGSTHPDLRTTSGLCTDCRPGPSSSSFGGRRKGLDLVGVSVEVPARTPSFSFPNSDEVALSSPAGQGFKSPTSRLLSFRRIVSREKRPISSPSSGLFVRFLSPCVAGSCARTPSKIRPPLQSSSITGNLPESFPDGITSIGSFSATSLVSQEPSFDDGGVTRFGNIDSEIESIEKEISQLNLRLEYLRLEKVKWISVKSAAALRRGQFVPAKFMDPPLPPSTGKITN